MNEQEQQNVFMKIIRGEIPSERVFEDDDLIVINDIHPKAKTHLLIIPKKFIPTVDDLNEAEGDDRIVAKMVLTAKRLAREKGLDGYRLQFNVGPGGGQEVFQLHLHLLSNSG